MTTRIWITEEQGKKAGLDIGDIFTAYRTSDGWVLEYRDHEDMS